MFDTSALIDWEHWYPFDVFPEFWSHLAQTSGQIWFMPEKVKLECHGALGDWTSKVALNTIWVPDTAALKKIAAIEQEFPGFAPAAGHINRADAYVVACALLGELHVVTSEFNQVDPSVMSAGPPFGKKQKMNVACQRYKIPCVHSKDMGPRVMRAMKLGNLVW